MIEKPIIFIVGNSRSGTTLMARILTRHPDIYIQNETHFVEEFSKERSEDFFLSSNKIQSIVDRMLAIQTNGYYRKNVKVKNSQSESIIESLSSRNEVSFEDVVRTVFMLEAKKRGKAITGDQTPRHVFYIRDIRRMLPEAVFINMIRDPRGVLLSQKHKWKAGIRLNVPKYETIRTYFNYHPILMSIMWRKGIEKAIKASKDIGNESLINVKFEDLTNHPRETIMQICKFLSVTYSDEMLDITVSMSSTKTDEGKVGISKKVQKAWTSQLSSTDIYFSEKINGDLLQNFNYVLTKKKPDLFSLIFEYLKLPLQIIIIVFLNLNRMGNPISFLRKRFE
ncbi:MAG: sulfotransferase [Anaerolineaceae bacterium]|nr:sulfotransferase [Anaerolineaceae bacterium]